MSQEAELEVAVETENLSELKVTEVDISQKESGDHEKDVKVSSPLNDVEKADPEMKPLHDNDNGVVNGDQKDSILADANELSTDNETQVSESNPNQYDPSSEEKNENKTILIEEKHLKEIDKEKENVPAENNEEKEIDGGSTNLPVDEDSDGEIVDSDEEDKTVEAPVKVDYIGLDDVARPELDQLDYDEDVDEGEIKDEVPEKKASKEEMSEGEIASSDGEVESDSENKDKQASGRRRSDEYEEGEMVDPSDGPVLPRETCRFFERGSCTWGDRCRFIHPGVNDKGGYKMFDSEQRRPPFFGPMPMRFPPPFDPRGHPMPPHFPPPMMLGPPPPETAWERGLRHAKEMRRRSMQRKVEEPDFMRKREVLSLNEALNVDRDLDYIVQKPLADEESGGDPFATLEEDERFAVPSIEDVKKMKRSGKSSRSDGRANDGMKRQLSPRSHIRREIDDRGRDRRSPPRHPGMDNLHSHNRHQAPPMPHHMSSHAHHDYRDRRDHGGERSSRHEKEYRDRSMKERDYRMDQSRNYPMDDWRDSSPRRREMESRVVAVDSMGKKKSAHSGRGETWSDPWARGRQSVKKRPSRSDSESSGSSSSSSSQSSFSSRSGSDSSRSSSHSSYSSSGSSSGSSRSPSPKKTTKKVVRTKKLVASKTAAVAAKAKNSPKPTKPSSAGTKPAATVKKTADIVKAKLTKPAASKSSPKVATAPISKPQVKDKAAVRGRPPVKTVPKKGKSKTYDSSSSSEFSHSSSSESRSRSRSAGKDSDSFSESESSSGSSSGSDSYTSSSGSSSGSSDEEVTKKSKPAKKVAVVKPPAPPTAEKKAVGKMPLPTKPGNVSAKINAAEKVAKPPGSMESRKRSAAAMSNPPTKKGAAIANRRSELLEQLKVVENAILKKRAKLT